MALSCSRKSVRDPLVLLLGTILLAALLGIAIAVSACSRTTGAGILGDDARAHGVWWAGQGAFLVAQFSAEDGNGVVIVWDRRVGKTFVPLVGYRVVAVEQAAPRVWLVPEDDFPVGNEYGDFPDLAGDKQDEKPHRLLAWDLASGEQPTDDIEARWRAWPGPGGYTAYPEVDVLKGSLVAKLLFQPSSGETEGSKAAIPEGFTTLDPIGWSASGKYFAAFAVQPGRWDSERRLLVFDPAIGSVVASETVWPGGVTAAWGTDGDSLHFFAADGLSRITSPGWQSLPYPAASSYKPPQGSELLGMVPAGALIWQPADEQGSEEGIFVFGDPEAGGESRPVLEDYPPEDYWGSAYDGQGSIAVVEVKPFRLVVRPVTGGPAETVWSAE